MPTITAIERHNPLVRPGRAVAPGGRSLDDWIETAELRETIADALDDLDRSSPFLSIESPLTSYSHLSDEELFEKISEIENSQTPTFVGDPFADDELADLALELANRLRLDEGFGDTLVAANPMSTVVAYAIPHADFPPEFSARVLSNIVTGDRAGPQPHPSYEEAAETLMTVLAEHPEDALALLNEPEFFESFIDWIDPDEIFPLDGDVAGGFALRALLAPDVDVELLPDGQALLAKFISTANTPAFEEGFTSPIGASLAVGFARYLPTMFGHLQGTEAVNGDLGPGLDEHVALGSHGELVDFVGALLRDPDAADVLMATLHASAISSHEPGAKYRIDQVGDYALVLEQGARNEEVEEEMKAAAMRALVDNVTVVVGFGAGAVLTRVAFGTTAKSLIKEFVKRSGHVASGSQQASDSGANQGTGALARTVLELALCESFLAEPERFRNAGAPLDAQQLMSARADLEKIQQRITDGVSLKKLNPNLEKLKSSVHDLGGEDHLKPLRDGSINELDTYDTEDDADT